jgi:hypothetical protein
MSEHARGSRVTEVKPQLIYTAKEIVDSRSKADKHDTVEQVKQTTENANVAVQQTQYTAIHAEVYNFYTFTLNLTLFEYYCF